MFFFNQSARKRRAEAQKFLHRLLDLTLAAVPRDADERSDARYPRMISLLLAPHSEVARAEAAQFGITGNVSSTGLGVVTRQAVDSQRVVVGFWLDERPYFLVGAVRQQQSLGGGFFLVGIEAEDLIPPADQHPLQALLPLLGELAPYPEATLAAATS